MAKKKLPRKTRGEFRPIYEAIVTGKDFLRLSPEAKLVFYTLRLSCGMTGIRTWPGLVSALVELTGYKKEAPVKSALDELRREGWVAIEGTVVWVIRALENEPTVSPNNDGHRMRITELLSGLPTSPLVSAYREHYADFLRPPTNTGNGDDSGGASPPPSPPVSGDGSEGGGGTPIPLPATPSRYPTPNPLPAAADDDAFTRHCTALAVAANDAITTRYGEQPVPLSRDAKATGEVVREFAEHGVDIGFAETAIRAYVLALRMPSPPNSMRFFRQHVLERWQFELLRRNTPIAETTGHHVATGTADALAEDAVYYARQGHEEWQAYCDEHGHVWRESA